MSAPRRRRTPPKLKDYVSGEGIDATLPADEPRRRRAAADVVAATGPVGQIDGNDVFIIERIVDVVEIEDPQLRAKVRWAKPYGPEDDTWEPIVNLPFEFQLQAKELLGFRLGFDNPLVTRIAFQPPPTPPEGFDPAALPPLPASANDPNLKESLKQGREWCTMHCCALPPSPISNRVQVDFLEQYFQAMSENLTFKGSKFATIELQLVVDERDKQLFPPSFPRLVGRKVILANELDSWFGGNWWRVVGRIDRTYVAVVEDDSEIIVDLASRSLCWVDHSQCPLCTHGFNFALDLSNDPNLLLAMHDINHAKGLSCTAIKSAVATRPFYRVKIDRVVCEPRFYFRDKLMKIVKPEDDALDEE